MNHTKSVLLAVFLLSVPVASLAAGLDPTEAKIVEIVDSQADEAVEFLTKVVNINSGTLNAEGVREVGEIYSEAFAAIGFDSRLIEQPEELQRGPHLFAEVDGSQGKRILLIGHLDTVFEPDSPFQTMRIDLLCILQMLLPVGGVTKKLVYKKSPVK